MASLKVPILVEMDEIRAYLEQNDIVEVVRCRDCKYSEVLGKSLIRYCDYSIIPMIRDDDGYCSCGERRTE